MTMFEKLKSLYEIVKDLGNMDALQITLDLQRDALDIEKEITNLRKENASLKENQFLSERIQRHEQPFLTMQDEPTTIMYCAHCWDSEKKLIQVAHQRNGCFYCPHCKSQGVFNLKTWKDFNGFE